MTKYRLSIASSRQESVLGLVHYHHYNIYSYQHHYRHSKNPVFSRSTNMESKLIDFFVFVFLNF